MRRLLPGLNRSGNTSKTRGETTPGPGSLAERTLLISYGTNILIPTLRVPEKQGESGQEPEDQLKVWLDVKPIPLEEPLIDFWRRQRAVNSTGRLAQMALDMASIPLMSSECERVFSQGKLLITGQRHRLKVDLIEATQCLRIWLIIDRKAQNRWRLSKKREKEELACIVPDIL